MRISKKVVEAISMQEFEDAMAGYAKAALRENELMQIIETEMQHVRERYRGELAYLGEQKRCMMELIQTYCKEQKNTLFCKRRSLSTLYGTVGYRLGTPKLKTLRGVNWKLVLEKLREQLPDYVRRTEEPAKDLLLADRHKEKVAPRLREIGIEVVQDEIFFIELCKTAA